MNLTWNSGYYMVTVVSWAATAHAVLRVCLRVYGHAAGISTLWRCDHTIGRYPVVFKGRVSGSESWGPPGFREHRSTAAMVLLVFILQTRSSFYGFLTTTLLAGAQLYRRPWD